MVRHQVPLYLILNKSPEDFVSRLSEAVQRIISDSEAAKLLTKHLAFENANSTCQAILHPVRRTGSLIDYMKQCADVGPSMLQGVAIAAVIKGNSYQQAVQSFFTNKNKPLQGDTNNQGRNAFPGTCFSCGQKGHTFMTALKEHPVLICLIQPNRLCLLHKTLPPCPLILGLFALTAREDIIGQGTVGQDFIEMEPF